LTVEPTVYVPEPEPAAEGSALKRALVALFLERRLPYTVSLALDSSCKKIGLRWKTVTAGGLRLRLRRLSTDEWIVEQVVKRKQYNPPGYEIGERDTVIDIGANIGAFSLRAARLAARGRVFAYEPVAENYALLLRNISLNRARNVVPCRQAVLDRKSTIRIYLDSENDGGHSVVCGGKRGGYEEVPAVPLQKVFDQHGIERCQFLKLDCEGAEYAILYNLLPEYYRRIDRIALEYHGELEQKRKQADQLLAFLEDVGFHIDVYADIPGATEGFLFARRREMTA
jgi:FkbM family methyltransferase